MIPRWRRLALLALFLCSFIGGFYWSADAHRIPQPRPVAPVPQPKPDPAVWDALAEDAARMARKLCEERGRCN